MNNFNASMLIVPIVALLFVIILHLSVLKKTNDKSAYNKYLLTVSIVAFLLNLAWEFLQLPLYKGGSYSIEHIVFCTLATVADVIMTLLIYIGLACIYRDAFWVKRFTWQRMLVVILIGGIGAILAEMRHTTEGNWAYADSMPLIPVVNVGLSPLLQFLVLPTLIYYISKKFNKL